MLWVESELRASGLQIEIEASGLDPLSLVDWAIDLKLKNARDARKSNDSVGIYSNVWALTDVDEFGPKLNSARERATANGIDLVITNPCFESWLVMHADGSSAPATRFGAQSHARSLGLVAGANDKQVVIAKIEGLFNVAEANSRRIRLGHETASTKFPHDTPSTRMDVLVRTLIDSTAESRKSFTHRL